ncbi:MAG: hypothetical protein JSS86_00525 [Cyanobacteria bacterium SZAS LIN-2]|nr:hypothetical protein [Cyanobacteria bacterium SZAS LIN-3]MBS1994753.1 hypothetical protein [Cyanobacteria bacterium SZAS LIN-2]MBS2009963.1 hypothetical protein [Cyanobacteria bacterium SZAS TMP-1]
MSFEHHQNTRSQQDEPSKAVQEEAAKIIAKLDGNENSHWHIDGKNYDSARAMQARAMLIEDAQKMTPKDMMDLMRTIMRNEDKTRGYDMNWFGHGQQDIREKMQKQDNERQLFFTALNHDMAITPQQRKEQVEAFNKAQALELERYKKEIVITFTHDSAAPSPGNNYDGRKPGSWIAGPAFNVANGLPEFHIDDKK